jgi:hypothetical protein
MKIKFVWTKGIIFLVFILFTLNCSKEKSPLTPNLKYFNPNKLVQLDLENIYGFWTSDTIKQMSTSDHATSVSS